MKIKKAKKRIVPLPVKKPKRLDLNEHQLSLQRLISEISTEDLIFLEGEIHRFLPPGMLKSPLYFKRGLRFYGVQDVMAVTGLSKQTVDKYVDGYLRIVRREGESAGDFSNRRLLADRPDAPLLKNLPEVEIENKSETRLVSSRVLLFLILAPAQVKGDKPYLEALRKILPESSFLQAGKPTPIHKNSSVKTWEVSS